ncbi:MAG: hypothetical protein JNJ64_00410 [Flavobacteriales bacterium]|nr:hypothetical protein [Flavobacteriales bacterium]
MTLTRRLLLYAVGLLIGGGLAWWSFGERLTNAAWTPRERIKLRVAATLVRGTPESLAGLQARGLDLDAVRRAIPRSEVLLPRTRRSGDSLFYTLRTPMDPDTLTLEVQVFEDHRRDSTATLVRVQ